MKVRIKAQPSGLLNGQPWPEVGEELTVPDVVGADLCASGVAAPVAEKDKAVEKRAEKPADKVPVKKAAAKKRA